MKYTEDQYFAATKLERWYRKFKHQVIEISGIEGTGVFDAVKFFLDKMEFDPREIMYLSFNQKQVLEMATKRYHCYYINSIIYKYSRIVDFDSIPILNKNSNEIEFEWKKQVKKKIDPRYKIMIVFDATLMNENMLEDLMSFGLPIILMTDPMLIPAPDSYTFLRKSNILLQQLNPELIKSPITYFANKALVGNKIHYGNYDTVSIVPRKQLNLYNLKSADMVITLSEETANDINKIYREKVMKMKTNNGIGERMIVMNNMYGHKITNHDEKRIKVFLTKGVVGYIIKCNKHATGTKYVPIEFKTEFYFEPFTDLNMDRHYLNGISIPSRQEIPDDIVKLKYAYALPVSLTRVNHWDKVTLIADRNPDHDISMQCRLLYNAITRAHHSITIIM
jgi:exodeoxyribonuclease V